MERPLKYSDKSTSNGKGKSSKTNPNTFFLYDPLLTTRQVDSHLSSESKNQGPLEAGSPMKIQNVEAEWQSKIEKLIFQTALKGQLSEMQECLTQDQQEIDNPKSQLERANQLNQKLYDQCKRTHRLEDDWCQSARLYGEKDNKAHQQLERQEQLHLRPNIPSGDHNQENTDNTTSISTSSEQNLLPIASTSKDNGKQIIASEAQQAQDHLEQDISSNDRAIVPRSTDRTLQNIPSNTARGDLIPASQSEMAQQADRAFRQNLGPADNWTRPLNSYARGLGSLFSPELHKQQVVESTQKELVVFDAIADRIHDEGVKAMEDVFKMAKEKYQPEIDKLYDDLKKFDRGTEEYKRILGNIDRKFEESQQYREAMCNQVLNTVGKLTPFAQEINRQLRSVGATSKLTEITNNAATNFGSSIYPVRFD